MANSKSRPRAKSKKKNKNKNIFLGFLLFSLILVFLILSFILIKNISNNNNNNSGNTNSVVSDSKENTLQNNESNISPTTEEIKKSPVQDLSDEEINLSKKRGLPVLMYHFFYDKTTENIKTDNNYMEIHDFEEQIKYLAENNYYSPTWQEVLDYINGKAGLPLKSVVITVDDGSESFFRLAVPVLEKYNFKATSFLITSWFGDKLNKENYPNVIDFQSHSNDMHKAGSDGKGAFLTLSTEAATEDLNKSKSVIGPDCVIFCYPFGHFNEKCKKILKETNYIMAFTTQGGRVFPGDDPYALKRVRMSKGDSLNAFISKVK